MRYPVAELLTFNEIDFYYRVTLRELHAFLSTQQQVALYSFFLDTISSIPTNSITTIEDFTRAKEAQITVSFNENVSDEEYSLLELMWSAIYFNMFDLGLNQEEALKRIIAYLYWYDPTFKLFYLKSVA